jgi:hypothetical protein
MTVRQTAHFVAELLTCDSEAARARLIAERIERPGSRAMPKPARRTRTDAEWMLADVATLQRAAARLESRLLAKPLAVLGPQLAELTARALMDLLPVLDALARTIEAGAATGGVQ